MFKLLLIWRYLIKKKVALIAMLAVSLIVMMVLVVLSVMSGLVDQAKQKNYRWTGDFILSRDSLVGFPYYDEFITILRSNNSDIIEEATPVITTFALIEANFTGQLYGVKLDEFCRVTDYENTLQYQKDGIVPSFTIPDRLAASMSSANLTDEQKRRGCFIGSDILQSKYSSNAPFNLQWDFTVFGLNSKGVLTGSEAGEHQAFWYLDEHRTGLIDVDDVILVDFTELQKLTLMDGYTDNSLPRTNEIRIKIKQGYDFHAAQKVLQQSWLAFVNNHADQPYYNLITDVTLKPWQNYRRDFIAPMEKEKSLMVVIFCMIGFVTIFIILAIFYMIVSEKVKDLGIIKSIGATRWQLAQIFLGYGFMIGCFGSLIGSSIGYAIVTNTNQIEGWLTQKYGFKLWDPTVYAIEKIPDQVDTQQAIVIIITAIVASIIGAALPAARAANLQVVEALRAD